MVLTGGTAGLAQSRYHPNAGKSAHAPVTVNAGSEVEVIEGQGPLEKEMIAVLLGKVYPEKIEEVVKGLRSVVDAWTRRMCAEEATSVNVEDDEDNRLATIGQMKKLL